jgi:outer membrane protein assembly factor BamB
LQEKSGTIRWQSLVDATAIVGITNDLVYVYAHNSTLLALQISNGKVRWKYLTGSATTDFTSFDMFQGVVYVGSSNASLSALDATTGAVLWHRTLGNTGLTGSALADGVLYASDRREIFAVQLVNGAVLWHVTLTNDLRAGEVTSLIISNSVAYTTVGDSTSETIDALNTSDGHILWHHIFPGQRLTDSNLLAVTDDIVLYADLHRQLSSTNNTDEQNASITALQGSNGSVLWQDQIAGFADPSISADHGGVYVVEQADSSSGLIDIVSAFQISTGTPLWHMDIPLN